MACNPIHVAYQEVHQRDLEDKNLVLLNNMLRSFYQSVEALNACAMTPITSIDGGNASAS